MICPFCNSNEDKVLDSREKKGGLIIRRRRECLNCHKRYTTYEKIEEVPFMVVKKDNSREPFERNKVLSGIMVACRKRPVSTETLENIVDEIEQKLGECTGKEISSREIGEFVIEQLKKLDEIAYVRFASVYRQFKDINQFLDELKFLLSDKK